MHWYMGKKTDTENIEHEPDPEIEDEDLDDEEEEDEDEEELEMFDPQELMDCLRSEEGQSIGDSLATIAKAVETQNKILLKILSAYNKS